jgi:hypothetical protein
MTAYAYPGLFSRAKMLRAEADMMAVELKCLRIASYAGLDMIKAQLRKKASWLMMTACMYLSLTLTSFVYASAFLKFVARHGSVYELDWNRGDEWLGLQNSDSDLLIPREVDDELITKYTVSTRSLDISSLTIEFNAEKRLR